MTLCGFFDTIHGGSLYGWASDDGAPEKKVIVEAVTEDGTVLGTAEANMFRGDLAAAEIAGGYCAYKIEISQNLVSLVGTNVCVRLAEYRTVMLPGSPQVITLNPNYEYLLTRSQRAQPILDKLRARLDREAGEGGISIIMPVYNTPQAWLVEALESVRAQWCSKWELICVNDGSTAPHVAAILSEPVWKVGFLGIPMASGL